jgi:hypothetical protein
MMIFVLAAIGVTSRLSISGIHTGDVSTQVFAALRRENYAVVRVSRSESFRDRLSDALNVELRQATRREQATAIDSVRALIGDQRLLIRFDDDAKGNRVVSSVHYEASSIARPFKLVGRMLTERYGPPTASDGTGAVWCEADPPQVCLASGVRGSRLKLGHDYRGFDLNSELTTIQLEVGTETRAGWAAGFKAALARLMRSKNAF